MEAKIIRSAKKKFDCKLLSGEGIISASPLGGVLKDLHPVVGDRVSLEKTGDDSYQITQIHTRSSEIFRRNVREYGKKKVIAANVDIMLVVMTASKPAYKSGLVDRYLVRSKSWNIPMMVIINKMDEQEENFDLEFEEKRLQYLKLPYLKISAEKPQDYSKELQELKEKLEKQTAIFVGQSGVGKSKLITTLTNGEVELLSNELAKVGKGAHTTTWAELIETKEFDLIDSPGIRSMALKDMDTNDLDLAFEDIFSLARECQFKDCTHGEKSKGCAFHREQDHVILSRLESYKRIRDEMEAMPNWQKKGLKT